YTHIQPLGELSCLTLRERGISDDGIDGFGTCAAVICGEADQFDLPRTAYRQVSKPSFLVEYKNTHGPSCA
ncbi:hypothetical protein NEOLEDRAFT_1135502, partial [Neolentinus lepideus HHB14362 ss-1]